MCIILISMITSVYISVALFHIPNAFRLYTSNSYKNLVKKARETIISCN